MSSRHIAYFMATSDDEHHYGKYDSDTFTIFGTEVMLTPCLLDNVQTNANVINLSVGWKTLPSEDDDE